MTPEHWGRVKAILAETLERRAEDREAYLAEACGRDAALRREVETLLEAQKRDWSFFDAPPPGWPPPSEETPRSRVGDRVGPYEILAELGHGGMGEVYLARRADDEFQKKVAIKLIRIGMASREELARFRKERQISAALEHPHIARLLDGGTTEAGEPFFVMEYVEGRSLLEDCARRGLTIEERLRLFEAICDAVEYAHRNLVVHRDIKPSNILVTEDGSPKLLDFGIAKLLDTEGAPADRTATVLRVLTPDYASPEQVRGGPITTATDVYSLGVVLYELLSGRRPYHVESTEVGELVRVVCEREPERPSAAATRPATDREKAPAGDARVLSRSLRGDLDAIVMKAMRKEPQRRYGSVAELAEDIRRHLEAQPVQARRGTLSYRSERFIRRHRVGLAAAAVIAVALAGGVLATLREARLARAAEARAQRRFNDVRKLANSVLVEFHDAVRDLPGSTPARQLLVRRGLEYLDSLASEAGDDPSLLRELAQGYRRLGELQGHAGGGSAMLGDMAGAAKSYGKAIALYERLLRSPHSTRADRLALAELYGRLSDSLGLDGDAKRSAEFARKAAAIAEAEAAAAPLDEETRQRLASSQLSLGAALRYGGQSEEALAAFERGLQQFERLLSDDPSSVVFRRSVFVALYKIGTVESERERNDAAAAAFRRATQVAEELGRGEPNNGTYRRDLSFAEGGLGQALLLSGDARAAEGHFRRSVGLMRRLVASDSGSVNPRIWLADSLKNLGEALVKLERPSDGRRQLTEAIGLLEPIVAGRPRDVSASIELAQAYSEYGRSYAGTRRSDVLAARGWHVKAQGMYLDLRGEGKLAPVAEPMLARTSEEVASCDRALGVSVEAD